MNLTRETLYEFLDASELDTSVSIARAARSVFHIMPFIEGIPGALLNAAVLAAVVAILNKNTNDSNRPAFVFIGNLAVSDLCLCAGDVFIGVVQRPETLGDNSELRTYFCKFQLSVYLFCFFSNLFGTILVTLDRYLFITKGMKYAAIVTRTRIYYLLSSAWIGSLAIALAAFPITRDRVGSECLCIVSHVVPGAYVILLIACIIVVFICIYALYGKKC